MSTHEQLFRNIVATRPDAEPNARDFIEDVALILGISNESATVLAAAQLLLEQAQFHLERETKAVSDAIESVLPPDLEAPEAPARPQSDREPL